ncbi:SynChlorMet cassette radical SAM/SPASM protein ScmE [Acidobacteriota bacterium]
MRTPRSVELAITNRCNLRCKYCFMFTSPADVNQDLPTEEWLEFFEELNRCAVTNVTLSGGEPFYREDLRELIIGIVRNRMRFDILSNGTLITDEISAFLASTGRCNGVQVSIDGSTPTTHDAFRGNGNFNAAMSGIKNLQKHDVPVTIRVTIHKQNVRDLEGVARLLLDDIGLPNFSTNAASYMGLCRKNTERVQLSTDERSQAMETLLKLKQKYNGRIDAQAGPLAEAEMWLEMEQVRSVGTDSMSGRGCLTSCGGVMQKIAVRSDGAIIPCSLLSHMELGRINKDSLKEVWQNHPVLNKFRKRQFIPLKKFNYCQDCGYINFCGGGCPALAYTLVGDEYQPSPDACLKRFFEEGGKLPHGFKRNGLSDLST